MEVKKEDVKRQLSVVGTRLSEQFKQLSQGESDQKGYKDSLVTAIVDYSKNPTTANYDKLKNVIGKPTADVDRTGFLQEIISSFSLEKTPKANTPAKKPSDPKGLNPLSADAREVDEHAESLIVGRGGRSGNNSKATNESLKAIDEMVGQPGVSSDFKKLLDTDARIAKAFVNGGLTVYDLMTYTSTSRLWSAISFLTVGVPFAVVGTGVIAVNTIGRLAIKGVKSLAKAFKAHKGTAEKAYVQKYRDSIKKGTKTTDKLIEILGKEKAEALEAIKEMGELIPGEIERGSEDPLDIQAVLREVEADGLSSKEKRARMESAEKTFDTTEKAQKGVLEDKLITLKHGKVMEDLATLDIPDMEPEVLQSFISHASIGEDGKIVFPNGSEITQENIDELSPEAQKRLKAVLSMPKIETLTDDQLVKLGKAVRIVEVDGTDGKKLEFDETQLGEDEALIKISKTFAENPDILPEDAIDLAEGANSATVNIEAIQAARRVVIADHKLEIAQSIRGQFDRVRDMSKQYTERGRASADGISKEDAASRRKVRDIAIAKVTKMSRKKLTDIIKAGDDAEKSIHEQAEGILLKDLMAVEQSKETQIEKQSKILNSREDPEEDMEIE